MQTVPLVSWDLLSLLFPLFYPAVFNGRFCACCRRGYHLVGILCRMDDCADSFYCQILTGRLALKTHYRPGGRLIVFVVFGFGVKSFVRIYKNFMVQMLKSADSILPVSYPVCYSIAQKISPGGKVWRKNIRKDWMLSWYGMI